VTSPTDKTLPTPDAGSVQLVQSYGPGRFRISGVEHVGPILLAANLCDRWDVGSAADISAPSLARLRAIEPRIEILVVGCGARATLLSPQQREELRAAGWSPEVMDTGAACRTYNVLLAEGRRVAAALLPL